MSPGHSQPATDHNLVYRRFFEDRQRTYLRTLVTPDVVAEHARQPLGQHSEALERLLIYFRGQPLAGKYAVAAVEPFKSFRIVALSGERGVPPRSVDDTLYASEGEALHGVFLKRVHDLLES